MVGVNRADGNVLRETYKAAKGSADMIKGLVSKTEDEDLSMDLNRQLGQYQKFLQGARMQLQREGQKPAAEGNFEKAKFWLELQAGTMLNNSTQHIANMVIEENAKGMGNLIRVLKDNQTARNEYCEFANELMDFTESSINQLKYYLKVL